MMNLVVVILISVFKRHGSKNQVKKLLSVDFFIRRLIQKNKYLKQIAV